jgi:hypothetical protein
MGFKVSQADKCLYLKGNIFVLFYVDDGLITATTIAGCNQVIDVLKEYWSVRVIGEPKMFLVREIVRDQEAHTMRICQSSFISKIVEESGLSNANPRKLPLAPSADFRPIEIGEERQEVGMRL